MSTQALVHHEAFDVDGRLEGLGLTVALLTEVVTAGEMARVACTASMPACFPGIAAWAYTVAELRERLTPAGWERSDLGNYPIVISPAGDFAIGVATGNENTGNWRLPPKTKFPKGPATIQKVEVNIQYSFFSEPTTIIKLVPATDQRTWLLLIARCADGVRSELSLPNAIGEDGRIDGWAERIILPTVDPSNGSGGHLPEPGPDIDVEIMPRVR